MNGGFSSAWASWATRLAAACLVLGTLACLAPAASAVVVHGSRGHLFGLTLRHGIKPAAIKHSVAASTVAAHPALASQASSSSSLQYHGGPVVYSSAPYLVFWAPSSDPIPSGWQSLMEQYFTDVAHDSGGLSNVYGVNRQFTDHNGFADYRQSFNAASQAILDTQPYPAPDSDCTANSRQSTCLSDNQLQAELQRLISANHLPTDGSTSATELGANAPVYFIVTPSDVDICMSDGSGNCASNDFCAYHSSLTDGGNNVLYATIPTLLLTSDPKGCQSDNLNQVQEPNGSLADVALKYISHEDSEALTDPFLTSWYNSTSGNEDGDDCNGVENNPNAFLPASGTSPTKYDQVINGHYYYLQSEWSNADNGCKMQPTTGAITATFQASPSTPLAGSSLTFDPTGSQSTSGQPLIGVTWDWGDGTTTTAATSSPAAAQHTYTSRGTYTVTLTLVDARGYSQSVSHQVTVYAKPTAAFTYTPNQPNETTPIAFDGTGSSDPNPGQTLSYDWNWGDGTADGTGAKPTHTYTTPGPYTVKLTVTDTAGLSTAISRQITVVDEPPTADFSPTSASPGAVTFTSTANDPDGSISNYSWSFSDGGSVTGPTATTANHTYSTKGVYSVTLTVTDSDHQTTTVTHQVTIGPIASFSAPAQATQGIPAGFDGSASTPLPGSSLSYDWSWGDGTSDDTTTGATPSHTYTTPGTYPVTLTVTNDQHESDHVTHNVTVAPDTPSAAFSVTTSPALAGYPIAFTGNGSSDPAGATLSYDWNWGDGTTTANGGATASHTYGGPGAYTVTLTVTNSFHNASSPAAKQITVNLDVPAAAFVFAGSPGYVGQPESFDATPSSDPGGSTLSYDWSWGDDTPDGAGVTPSHTYAGPGSYTVTLTATNSQGHSSSTSRTVTVAPDPPNATFAVTTPLPLAGQAVGFDGSGSSAVAGSIASYSWSFGDGAGASGPTASHTFAVPGSYTVSLTVTDTNGQSSTVSQPVTIHTPPSAGFSISPGAPLDHQPVTFDGTGSLNPDATTTLTSYVWDFGDGSAGYGAAASHSYAAPGTYTVTLTVSNNLGLTSTSSRQLNVGDEPPSAGFTVLTAKPASGQSVSFSGAPSTDSDGSIVAYRWSFGDGASATGPTPGHAYARPGTYTVTLTVTDSSGQSASVSQLVTVALSGRITKVAVRTTRKGATMLVTVNSSGRLTVGRTAVYMRAAGVARVAIALTKAQRQTLSRTHRLKLRIALRFAPSAGPLAAQTASVTFHGASGHLAAVASVRR